MTPTQKTLAWCKEHNFSAQVVERWNSFAKRRIDLFGFIDLVYITGKPNSGVTGVQCCITGDIPKRRDKIFSLYLEKDSIRTWLLSGNSIEIHGWAKRGAKGKRKLWTLIREMSVFNSATNELTFVKSNNDKL